MRTPPCLLEDVEPKEDNQPIPAAQEVDFSEYMWMGEELEEFDRQVEEELWEQAFIEACFEDMLAEEEIHWFYSQLPHNPSFAALPPLVFSDMLVSSKLNPEAPEFVPKSADLVTTSPVKSVM